MVQGSRWRLRPIRDEDECRRLFEIYNDLSQRAPTDHDELAQIEDRLAAFRADGLWSETQGLQLLVDASNTMLGTLTFRRTSALECDLGYRVLRFEHRGRGLLSEALPHFCAALFQRFPSITRLSIRTAHDNVPSRRLAERCGFQQEGVLRHAYQYRGKLCDWIVYGLVRADLCSDRRDPEPSTHAAGTAGHDLLKLSGANMDIDLSTPVDRISWTQDSCPWNAAESTDAHRCAVKNVTICRYFRGIEPLDTVRCCYPNEAPK